MRHIPEEELHAYLDQALSRSQCVEIERHLAGCGTCRSHRDAIAGLRDRTTALLSSLAPERHRIPPSYELLSARAGERRARRLGRRRAALWAASVLVTLGVGWGAQALIRQAPAQPASLAAAPRSTAAPMVTAPDSSAVALEPTVLPATSVAVGESRPRPAEAAPPSPDTASGRSSRPSEPVGAVLSSARLPQSDFELAGEGMWRTLSWDNAQRERGESVPRIQGLPVVEVQVAAARDDSDRPTMVVAQQLRSGQMIRTIEGPATDVTRLLSAQRSENQSPWPTVPDSSGLAGADGTMAMRRGDRILAIQAPLPPDSLRAMIRRLNALDR